jgi:hypothetical protein
VALAQVVEHLLSNCEFKSQYYQKKKKKERASEEVIECGNTSLAHSKHLILTGLVE